MRSRIARMSPGDDRTSRDAAGTIPGRRPVGRGLRRLIANMMLAAVAMAALLAAATPSSASLFDGIYEDASRLEILETASGQYNAGISLLRTVQNFAGAAKWFRRAADQGHANAQAVLGSLYAVGLGVPKDFVNAYAWVSLALPRLDGRMRDRAEALQEELTVLMTTAQIGEAQKITVKWRPFDH